MSRISPEGTTTMNAQTSTAHGHACCPHCPRTQSTATRSTIGQGPRPWDNPDPLWGVPEWSNYVGIKPDFTRQLIKQGRVSSIKIGGKTMLPKSVADDLINAGMRPATAPIAADRFGNWR